MSSSARPPRRPSARGGYAHPPAVYRRRRVVLVTILLIAGWGIVKLLPGGADGGDARPTSAGTTATPTPTATTPTATPAKKAKAPEKRKKNRVVRVSMPAPEGTCDPSTVSVTPSVKPGTYAGGSVPVRLTFATTAKQACTLDIGAKNLLLAVNDDDGSLWESSTCDEVSDQSVTLQPTWSTTLDVTWSGRESRKGCKNPGEFVAAGDYTVKSALLGGEPGEAAFTLATRPAPKPEPKKKTGETDKKSDGKSDDSDQDAEKKAEWSSDREKSHDQQSDEKRADQENSQD